MQATLGIPSSLQTWWGPPQRSFSGPSSSPSPAGLLPAANEGSTELDVAGEGSPSGGAQQQLVMQQSEGSPASSSGGICNLASHPAVAIVGGQRQGLLSG